MSVSYLLHYYLHAVISFASITSADITIVAPLYPSFLFFLSANEYFYFVPTVAKLYKPDSSHGPGTSSRGNVVIFYYFCR